MAANASLPEYPLEQSRTLRSLREHSKEIQNPLEGMTREDLANDATRFATLCEVESGEEVEIFVRGVMLAAGLDVEGADAAESAALKMETERKWKLSWALWVTCVGNAMAAVVQGMDETVINGAQVFFLKEFGIETSPLIIGLVIGAPYLCCAVLGCWLSDPINKAFGRRWSIFVSMLITALASVGQAGTGTWQPMLASRIILGLGIGVSSATVPIYSAECAPASVRGGLTMQWQVFTAFGIMLGNAVSLMFFRVPNLSDIHGLNWRLMMGAPAVPALFVCAMVFRNPESPRWLMSELSGPPKWWPAFSSPERSLGAAYRSMCRLRRSKLQAARDCYYAWKQIQVQEIVEQDVQRKGLLKLFKVARYRRALYASQTVMVFQQLCGINVIAYYSSKILVDADFSRTNSLIVSFGIGCTNFLFALPAIIMIDKFGRRPLLLATAPIMAGFLALTGAAFNLPLSSGLPTIISGLFLFVVAYSPGGGPVPFTYCAESWPLQVRSLGMGINTATTWLFNFLISFTFPLLVAHIGQQGTFYLYCGLNCMLEVLVWLLVPETRMLSLEELDVVFSVPTQQHISANWKALRNWRVPRRERKEKTYLEEDGVVVIPWPEKNVQRVLVEEVLSRSSDAEESSET